jgi:RNA-directed DNA polymerase
MSEIPVHFRPRRVSDWINPTGAKKVHSLIDKVYKRKNLEMAWEKVQANRSSGGDARGVLSAARSATGTVAQGASGRCLSTSTGAVGANPKVGEPGEYRS